MLAVGLFAAYDPIEDTTRGRYGLFHGGGMYLFGVQLLACVSVTAWSCVVSAILLLVRVNHLYLFTFHFKHFNMIRSASKNVDGVNLWSVMGAHHVLLVLSESVRQK